MTLMANQRSHTPLVTNRDKCIGYKLIVRYPNCNYKVGDFVPYTTGAFSEYPGVWKALYEKDIVDADSI